MRDDGSPVPQQDVARCIAQVMVGSGESGAGKGTSGASGGRQTQVRVLTLLVTGGCACEKSLKFSVLQLLHL